MTKALLLRDLYGRMPYGVKAVLKQTNCYDSTNHEVSEKDIYSFRTGKPLEEDYGQHDYYKVIVTDIKPYLFPLSSMTEEQYNSLYESGILNNCSHSYEYVNPHIHGVSFIFKEFKTYSLELIEWLLKNHFDIYGLIPMNLAIDATNLNIY